MHPPASNVFDVKFDFTEKYAKGSSRIGRGDGSLFARKRGNGDGSLVLRATRKESAESVPICCRGASDLRGATSRESVPIRFTLDVRDATREDLGA